jgi:uncharacterized protein YbjQ (UPF0145 family)
MKNIALILTVLFVGGCAGTGNSSIPQDKLQATNQIKTYTAESNNHPEVAEYVGGITAHSYNHVLLGRPASKEDALARLKLKASEFGADGIIDVTIDASSTNTWGTNGLGSIKASGIAVKFKNNK